MSTNAYPARSAVEKVQVSPSTWQAEHLHRFGPAAAIARLAMPPTELELIIAEQPIVPAANPMRYRS
jgi:hypothetical protein